MRLSKVQRRSLEIYLSFRDTSPSLPKLVRLSGWRILLIPSYCLMATAFFYFYHCVAGIWLMAGILIGFLSSTLAQYRLFLKVWPAVREVLDWNELKALLGKDRGRPEA